MAGDVALTKLPHFVQFANQEIEIINKASLGEALLFVQNNKFSSLIIFDSNESPEALGLAIAAKNQNPMAPRILISNTNSEQWIRDGINKAQVFRFLKAPVETQQVIEILEKALLKQGVFLNRSLLLREASHQNKQLEALTTSLEVTVEERTQHIEASNKEQTEKLNRERHLIRFIKDIASQTSFEDILQILRREIRKFHKLGDPILVYRLNRSKTTFLSFHSGHFTQTETSKYFEFPKTQDINNVESIRIFANHFGRPFAKSILLPLELKLISHLENEEAEAILCLEHSLSEKEITPFLEFISDRVQALEMVLDRVLLEHHLSAFSYRWEKTFDGMRDPVAIVDVDFNIIRANKKFSDKLIQKKCYESFAGRTSKCEGCPISLQRSGPEYQNSQIEIKNRLYQLYSYPIKASSSDRATNFVHQYVDITQAREIYLRMLQNEKMGAIGLLAGNIAHELNNPLTGLRSLAQVLISETNEPTLKADLLEIEKASMRSQKIIKNLLDFSKGESQLVEAVSIDEVVEKTLPMLKSAMRNHRNMVELNTSNHFVMVEPHLLQQVVFNLINNACQAMKEPGQLSVISFVKDKLITLEISDTGPGIDEQIANKIFEPFFTTKKEGNGTGLGLSMSKSVIEKFKGKIFYKKNSPHGATFVIELPVHSKRD